MQLCFKSSLLGYSYDCFCDGIHSTITNKRQSPLTACIVNFAHLCMLSVASLAQAMQL